MRDVMRRSKRGGGKVTLYKARTLPDGRVVLVPQGEPRRAPMNNLSRHMGERGEVTEGCACAECAAAGMTPAPPPDARDKLDKAARAKLDKLEKTALDAVEAAKRAMTAYIVKRGGEVRRKHNPRSLKLKHKAIRAYDAYKRAEAMYAATKG